MGLLAAAVEFSGADLSAVFSAVDSAERGGGGGGRLAAPRALRRAPAAPPVDLVRGNLSVTQKGTA